MNINGVMAIKSVRKSQNENGRTMYTGEAVFKDFANFISMPFMLVVNNDKAVNFYDSYIMQPGKSGYASGKLSTGQNGVYLNLDSMEFGSLKIDGANNNQTNGGYQKNNYQNQQPKQEPVIENNSSGFNFNNFNNQNNNNETSSNGMPSGSGQSFWGNFAKK